MHAITTTPSAVARVTRETLRAGLAHTGSECSALLPPGSDAVRTRSHCAEPDPAAVCRCPPCERLRRFLHGRHRAPHRLAARRRGDRSRRARRRLRAADAQRVARARAATPGRSRSRGAHPRRAARPARRGALHLPFEVGDYVDFYSSLEHATNLGRLFRPDGGAAAAQLALAAGRLSRARGHGRRQRHRVRRPRGQLSSRTGRAGLRADAAARHRARARLRRRRAEPARRAGTGRSVRRARLRRRARQRLERPRHPGVGVRAARAVPRQVVPDLDLGLGDPARAARGAPRRGAAAGAARRSPISPAAATGRSTSTSRSS